MYALPLPTSTALRLNAMFHGLYFPRLIHSKLHKNFFVVNAAFPIHYNVKISHSRAGNFLGNSKRWIYLL